MLKQFFSIEVLLLSGRRPLVAVDAAVGCTYLGRMFWEDMHGAREQTLTITTSIGHNGHVRRVDQCTIRLH